MTEIVLKAPLIYVSHAYRRFSM